MTKLVQLDSAGSIVRGLAVPFNECAIIVHDGQLIAEHFDEHSITRIPEGLPLLVGHDRTRAPAGVVLRAQQFSAGVGIEAQLVGSDHELDGWRRRFEHGLMTALSIGFTASGRQHWQRPTRQGQPPRVTRRNAELIEISLVNWAAYQSAGLTSLNERTAQRQREHEVATEMVAEFQTRQALAHRESERLIAETRPLLAWAEQRRTRSRGYR